MKTIKILTVLFCVILFFGCGPKRPEGLPELVPCQIKIVMDGQPVEKAEVALKSDRPETMKWGGNGTTNAAGIAEIYSYSQYRGAVPGEYVVTVQKKTIDIPPPSLDGKSPPPKPPKHFLHSKFADPAKSPLKIEITPKNNPIFELTVEPTTSNDVHPVPKWK